MRLFFVFGMLCTIPVISAAQPVLPALPPPPPPITRIHGNVPNAEGPLTVTVQVTNVNPKTQKVTINGTGYREIAQQVPYTAIENGRRTIRHRRVSRIVPVSVSEQLQFSAVRFYDLKMKKLSTKAGSAKLQAGRSIIYTTDVRDISPQQLIEAPENTIVVLKLPKKTKESQK